MELPNLRLIQFQVFFWTKSPSPGLWIHAKNRVYCQRLHAHAGEPNVKPIFLSIAWTVVVVVVVVVVESRNVWSTIALRLYLLVSLAACELHRCLFGYSVLHVSKVNHEDMRVDYVLQHHCPSTYTVPSSIVYGPNHRWSPKSCKFIQINCSWIAVGYWIPNIPKVPTPEASGCSRPWLPLEIGTHSALTAERLQDRPVFFFDMCFGSVSNLSSIFIIRCVYMCISCILYMYTMYHETWWRRRCILTLHCVYIYYIFISSMIWSY